MSGEQKLNFESLDKEYFISIERVHSDKEGYILRLEVENKISLKLWVCDVLETRVQGKARNNIYFKYQELTKHIAESIDECFSLLKDALSDNDSNLIKKGVT